MCVCVCAYLCVLLCYVSTRFKISIIAFVRSSWKNDARSFQLLILSHQYKMEFIEILSQASEKEEEKKHADDQYG